MRVKLLHGKQLVYYGVGIGSINFESLQNASGYHWSPDIDKKSPYPENKVRVYLMAKFNLRSFHLIRPMFL